MSKIIKLKQSDLENIVKRILAEQEIGDEESIVDNNPEHAVSPFLVGKDKSTGEVYVVNTKTGQVFNK